MVDSTFLSPRGPTRGACALAASCLVAILLFGVNVSPSDDASHPDPPKVTDPSPRDYEGIHNVVAFAEGVYSGAAPEDRSGFHTLAELGVRTIISVDGAVPAVSLARAEEIRYVHLPMGYNGLPESRRLEISRAVRDLPGTVYIHCHHGKHRSASAAGAVVVTLGLQSTDEAISRMKVSGTSPRYPALYECVASASPADEITLNAAASKFPETVHPNGLVQGMIEIDHTADHLYQIERAGWLPPPSHPDLVPAAEAGRLADLLRHLRDDRDVAQHSHEFVLWMDEAAEAAALLEARILDDTPPAVLSTSWDSVVTHCQKCHEKYRNATFRIDQSPRASRQ